MKNILSISVLAAAALVMSGCDKTESTLGGGALGSLAGAGLGYAIGGGAGGAVLGGVVGGLGGAAIGHHMGDDEESAPPTGSRTVQQREEDRDLKLRAQELERQRLELEKQRLELERTRAGLKS